MAKLQNRKHTVTGIGLFPKVFEEVREMNEWNDSTNAFDAPCKKDGSYQIAVDLTQDEFTKLRKVGSMQCKYSQITDEGLERVKFKRFHKDYDSKGKIKDWISGAPKVFKEDGSVWSFEDDGPIFNNAKVEVVLDIVDFPSIKGITRIESVKVLEQGPEPVEREDDNEVPF